MDQENKPVEKQTEANTEAPLNPTAEGPQKATVNTTKTNQSLVKNPLFWGPALIIIAIVVVFLVLGPSSKSKPKVVLSSTTSSDQPKVTKALSSSSAKESTVTTLPSGTSNADLKNDLNSINSNISQENSDQGSANTALNDSSSQITIPTN